MHNKRHYEIIGLIIGLVMLRGLIYGLLIPFDQAPDEKHHFLLIKAKQLQLRHASQDETQETVCTNFQGNRCQYHRTTSRRFHVGIRQPSVYWPHWHFHRERQEEGDENQDLGGFGNLWNRLHVQDGEAAASQTRQVNQRYQHQQ